MDTICSVPVRRGIVKLLPDCRRSHSICKHHVRIDMREGADGKLRIMEVNGIPGLKPVKSWSPQIYGLYHPGEDSYTALIGTIVSCALERAYEK